MRAGDWLGPLSSWWEAYVRRFLGRDAETDYHVRLKVAHTARVRTLCLRLAAETGLAAPERELAEAAALLHDVGRFPQYWRHRTFRDLLSVDHAALGVETLDQEQVWPLVPAALQSPLRQAVAWHNKKALPAEACGAAWLPAKLVRDADKLDIFDMLTTTAAHRMPPSDGIAPAGGLAPAVAAAVAAGRLAEATDVKTAADQQVFRISWVYDLNTAAAVRYFVAAGFLPALLAAVPEGEAKRQVRRAVEGYLRRRLGEE